MTLDEWRRVYEPSYYSPNSGCVIWYDTQDKTYALGLAAIYSLSDYDVQSRAGYDIYLSRKRPKWTVFANIDDGHWVGTSWRFFESEAEAEDCRAAQERLGHVPTKRPYHPNDEKHLGAAHR
jgi:hypothetical protein